MRVSGKWIYDFEKGLAYRKIRAGVYQRVGIDGVVEVIHSLPTYIKQFAELKQHELA